MASSVTDPFHRHQFVGDVLSFFLISLDTDVQLKEDPLPLIVASRLWHPLRVQKLFYARTNAIRAGEWIRPKELERGHQLFRNGPGRLFGHLNKMRRVREVPGPMVLHVASCLAALGILVPLILKAIGSGYADFVPAVTAVHDAGKSTVNMKVWFECVMVAHCLRPTRLTVRQGF